MNWILGLIGALFGLAISEENWLVGFVLGFFVMFFMGSLSKLRRRMDMIEKELAIAHAAAAQRESLAEQRARESWISSQAPAARPEPLTPAPVTPAPSASRLPVPPVAVVADGPAMAPEPAPAVDVRTTADVRFAAATSTPPSASPARPAQPSASRPAAPVLRPAAVSRAHEQPSREPSDWVAKLVASVKTWFTEGNVPVKVGILVFIVGIAAALRYAVAQGLFSVPIEVRMALIAAAGLGGLVFGWRERERRPAFGLSVQGGGLGVLMMTVFTAYRMYSLLPATAAFALVIVLVAGSALLAVLQDAIALAALGFLGGYLAPVLISTGSHDHVALFTYYALLNAAVFGVSWKRSWRLLNLIGFAFTFGVGTAWGQQFYRPELFASVEPFLILFFVFYVVIGLLYVIRQTEYRRPWVDGTLVFGTPMLAFPMQAGLLKDDRLALAFSALIVSIVYFGLVWWLRRRRGERLLTDAYAALALCFATLAVPLAFSAGTTASVWALEGAGVAWLGIRQNRTFPWLAGLALQVLAAGAYMFGAYDTGKLHVGVNLLLLNPTWLGAALIAVGGYALNLVHDRLRPIRILPTVLFAWSTFWWLIAGVSQLDLADGVGLGEWRFAMAYLAATIALAATLRVRLPWPRMEWLTALCTGLVLLTVLAYERGSGGPLAPSNLGEWAALAAAMGWALRSTRGQSSRSLTLTHLLWMWTVAVAASLQAGHLAEAWKLADGWQEAMTFAPLLAATFVLWRKPAALAWPRAELFADYRNGWFAPAAVLLAFAFLVGLLCEGTATPLPFVPVLNPLEISLIAILALLYGLCEGPLVALRKLWPYAGFALATSATLRAVHHWHGEPWSAAVFDSGVSQMALTVVWSLLGVGSWIAGSKRGNRRLWMGGAVLMGVVLLKLIALDRHYTGDVSGIASFVVVGLLMVGVGYIAPSPPKLAGEDSADAEPDEARPVEDEVEPT